MPTRSMAHHNYLIGHNTSPDRNKTNPTPNRSRRRTNPKGPCYEGIRSCLARGSKPDSGSHELASNSVSRDPTTSTASLVSMACRTAGFPMLFGHSMFSLWLLGKLPWPPNDVATGAARCSATTVNSGVACDSSTPFPLNIIGRSACARISVARSMASLSPLMRL